MRSAARQLDLIAETVKIAKELRIEVWLRGGWAMDFFLGKVTREHEDIDWFTWIDDAPALALELTRHDYAPVPGPPREQQLDFNKQDVDLSFALLSRDPSGRVVVGGGPWKGAPWPENMIGAYVGRIDSLTCPIISPAAQIEIKQMMPVWIPGRPTRVKDIEDIARLQAAVVSRGEESQRP
ncbi:nucleotidyltransferase domain-containing protein [Sphaerisporangium aureirubrum]|uniref:Nucleotidyltransferase domain-containing protein n=1 Tax=Sphaerisporangium aureirubrum TaxID=1544736 RepID=A0ABW1NDT3_9ACTN